MIKEENDERCGSAYLTQREAKWPVRSSLLRMAWGRTEQS